MISIIPTNNEEVDRQIGGGLPLPSLILVEGEHGTGKSAMTAQFMKGVLDSDKRVLLISTENTALEYISKMKTIQFNFSRYYLQNKLAVLPVHLDGMEWSEKRSKFLLPVIGRYMNIHSRRFDVAVIDSISILTMDAKTGTIMDFFTGCKQLVANGVSVIMTIHPNAISNDIALRIRSVCDGYFRLSSTSVAGRSVKVMEVIKLIGSSAQITSQFSFDVDQTFGIKIVPLSMANA